MLLALQTFGSRRLQISW